MNDGLDLQQALQVFEDRTVTKELLKPGKNIHELLMRTRLSRKEAILITRLYYKAERFDLDKLRSLILTFLEALVSVDGMSRKEVVQVATHQVVPQWLEMKQTKEKVK